MKSFLSFLFLPIVELFSMAKNPRRNPVMRFFFGTLVFFFLIIIWANFLTTSSMLVVGLANRIGDDLGFIGIPVRISGTGSMYPTFPKGQGSSVQEQSQEDVAEPLMRRYPGGFTLFGKTFHTYALQHGDIVSFENTKTQEIIRSEDIDTTTNRGFVKRVIGLPGDTIEIRNGFVLVNGEQIEEPYTASARSTFGGKFLPDCAKLTIPEDQVFVMGDNRKGSNDSRYALDLVEFHDISRVLPVEQQTPYKSLWRDASKDITQSHTAILDTKAYIQKLNDIRKKNGVKPIKYEPRLEQSARLRAQVMLKYNDLSFEATRSGYTMQRAMQDAHYDNILWGEAPTLGYYTADELLENYTEFPEWKKFLLDSRYQDTGVAAVIGEINHCPVQIVVQHVAGYLPPNYKKEEIDSWLEVKDKLSSVLTSWENARSFGAQYEEHKDEYEKIIGMIHERIDIATRISARMQSNQWLTEEDKQLIEKDKALGNEQEELAKKLNAY